MTIGSGSSPTAVSYREEVHHAVAADTWEKLAKHYYYSEAPAVALREYNRAHPQASERLHDTGSIAAGDVLRIPPLKTLERHGYSPASSGGAAGPSGSPTGKGP
jgi:hypothetical protein